MSEELKYWYLRDHKLFMTLSMSQLKQLCIIAQDFPQITFVRVCGATTADIRELKVFNNLLHIPMQMFQDRVLTGQDL